MFFNPVFYWMECQKYRRYESSGGRNYNYMDTKLEPKFKTNTRKQFNKSAYHDCLSTGTTTTIDSNTLSDSSERQHTGCKRCTSTYFLVLLAT